MPNKKVLIAYIIEYGFIGEISEEIAKTLREEGLDAQLLDIGKTKLKNCPLIEDYDGLLIGSCHTDNVTAWPGLSDINKVFPVPVRKFLRKNEAELKNREKILGIFLNDPSDLIWLTNPPNLKEYLGNRIRDKLNINADIFDIFGPVIDLSSSSKIKMRGKKFLRDRLKHISKKSGLVFDKKGKNDFRDWDQIRNFSIKFAKLLKGESV